ncbi:MAG: ATP-dependent zinc protease [Bacteroidetes bacterium]|nr:ATP-dependent zinc protease [Bacteroidota bacterium]MBK9671242.1 ATP-dependent zinc protease [Bacteroidota bacterium]MBP6413673.1 ATP-dependent zinc protease [Bacteroidia bacterium]
MNTTTKISIGRREKVSFPELELQLVDAKIDTGAYTAALHCSKIWIDESKGVPTLCFKILDHTHPRYSEKTHEFLVFGKRKIKNSSGIFESRFTIKTPIKIGRKKIQATLSLTDRAGMKYPVLIGRKLLHNRFIVDVTALNLLEKKTK